MQPCCSARRLLAGGQAAALPPVSGVSLDRAQRAQMERVLGVTTTVLFVASVSYIALSALYGCLCVGRRGDPGAGDGESVAPTPAAASQETKRALEGIPVRVVQIVVRDGDGNDGGAGEPTTDEEAGDCAVCLAEYAAGDEVRVLPACRHGFHRECVDRWLLARAPTCPICRAPVARVEGTDSMEGCASGHDGDGERNGGIGFVPAAGSRMLPAIWP